MWFRLAGHLGRTVRELQESMDSAEFGEWVAFYGIEPFGDRVEDMRAGTIASVMANVHRSPKQEPYKPLDFVPWAAEPEGPKGPPTAEAMASLFGVNLTEAKASGEKRIIIRRKRAE